MAEPGIESPFQNDGDGDGRSGGAADAGNQGAQRSRPRSGRRGRPSDTTIENRIKQRVQAMRDQLKRLDAAISAVAGGRDAPAVRDIAAAASSVERTYGEAHQLVRERGALAEERRAEDLRRVLHYIARNRTNLDPARALEMIREGADPDAVQRALLGE